MMRIIVPSLGRAGTANSMKWLPDSGRDIIFAVHTDEAEAYKKAYPHTEIHVLPDSCRKHTGLVRKEIMRAFRDPFFFVDDDIRLSLKTVTSIVGVFDVLEGYMEGGRSMAGLGQQLFSNMVVTEPYGPDGHPVVKNKFVATVYGIDPTVFDDCPLEKLPVYEDVALIIHAIQHGNGTLTSYCATHSNVSPPSGGCNSWRDPKITLDSLQALVDLYPGICSIRPTNNTTHSQNIGVGLRTAWSKIKKLS